METNTQTDLESMLTPRQLCKRLAVTPAALEKWRNQTGKGPRFIRLTNGLRPPVRYRLRDVIEWESKLTTVDPMAQNVDTELERHAGA